MIKNTFLFSSSICIFFSPQYLCEKIINLKKNDLESNEIKSLKYDKILSIDNKTNITLGDYISTIVYKYLYVNNQNEIYLLDKIIQKRNKNIVLKINMKNENINYKQISVSLNKSKDKFTRDKLIIYEKCGFLGLYLFDKNKSLFDNIIKENNNISNIDAACFSNSLKFISQYKLRSQLIKDKNKIIKYDTNGNDLIDVVSNWFTNFYFNLCIKLHNLMIFKIYTMLYYNIKYVKSKDQIEFNNKYNIVNFVNSKEKSGHMLAVINDNKKIIIYDINFGIFEFNNTNDAKKFIINIAKSYNYFDTMYIYEFI